jgi:hypothetical protein
VVTKLCFFSLKASGIIKNISLNLLHLKILFLLKYNILTFRFSLPLTATAENCLLTIYPYLAVHLDKQGVVLKDGKLHKADFSLSLYRFLLSKTNISK